MRVSSYTRYFFIIFFLLCFSSISKAQQVETGYFMDNYSMRHTLNPALRPATGYISLFGLGDYDINFSSNSLSFDKLIYPNGVGNELVTFLHPSVDANTFINSLARVNTQNSNSRINILSFGFFHGKSFWNFGVNLRSDFDFSIPKDLFVAMKLGVDNAAGQTFNVSDLRFDGRSYAEAALGYSRPVNDRLTLGGKVKFLVGFEDFKAYFKNMQIKMSADAWNVTADGQLDVSMKGLKPKFGYDEKFQKTYINGFDYKSPGIGGYGSALDLGANYKLTKHLTLSAAVLDLGFIKWDKIATTSGVTNGEYSFNGFDLGYENSSVPSISNQLTGIKDSLINLAHYTQTESKQRTTYLRSTLKVGAEYAICNGKLSLGTLSSTFFGASSPYTELTSSLNFKPLHWLSWALSYSWMYSDFNTFGFALNLSPSWINLFIASDYALIKVNPQYIPINQRAINFRFGINIPFASNRCK